MAKSWHSILLSYPGVENFDKIALSLTVKEIEAILCFSTFSKKNDEIAVSPTVKGIEAILCFATFHLALKWPSLSSELKAKAKIVN